MIRALSVIGHGTNLISHYVDHYKKYVDEIQFVVYQSDMYPNLLEDVKEKIKNYNNVKIVKVIKDRVFDWEKVTSLYNFIKNTYPNDWWVVADIDEFHLYPNDHLPSLIKTCNNYGYDVIRGGFIDRIGPDGEFVELRDDISIWKQFPNAGFFRYPMSHANPNKICVMKGYVELTSGQHYAKLDGFTTWRWQGWNHPLIYDSDYVQVHHFKWDKTSIDRIKEVASVKQDYAYSDEYQKMYNELRKTKFKIDLTKHDYMFSIDHDEPKFLYYKRWNKLIKKIISI